MALNLSSTYPTRVTAPDADYSYGSSKNETTPGAGDGTPTELARSNDVFGLQQSLLRAAGITPSNVADTQLVSEYVQAIVEIASGRAFQYVDSGAANAYVLTNAANQQKPRSLFAGMRCEFTPTNNNTGASTVDVAGIGVVNIYHNGAALVGGELDTTRKTIMVYNGTQFDLELRTRNVWLPTPEALVVATVETGWVTHNSTTLNTAKAVEAYLALYCGGTYAIASINQDFRIRIFLREVGSGIAAGDVRAMRCSSRMVTQVASGATLGCEGNAQSWIKLDTNHDFDYDFTSINAPTTEFYQIHLVGYKVYI